MAFPTGDSPQPHELLWFSDGNVVLATDQYLFKVHKSLLALHSSVFKDMFELLNVDGSNAAEICVGSEQDVYEGLPLVTLVGDKGEDVVHLLRTIYELKCGFHAFFASCSFAPSYLQTPKILSIPYEYAEKVG